MLQRLAVKILKRRFDLQRLDTLNSSNFVYLFESFLVYKKKGRSYVLMGRDRVISRQHCSPDQFPPLFHLAHARITR